MKQQSVSLRILEALAVSSMTTHEIAYRVQASLDTVRRLMPALENMGKVVLERKISAGGAPWLVWSLKRKEVHDEQAK